MKDIRDLLREILVVKGISPEQAANYIGCSSMQIRRWIKYSAVPGLLHRKAIKEGIKKIQKEIPDIHPKPGFIYKDATGKTIRMHGAAGRTGEVTEPDEKMEEAAKKVLAFFNELALKVDSNEKFVLDAIANYMGEIIELILMAKKYNMELPKI